MTDLLSISISDTARDGVLAKLKVLAELTDPTFVVQQASALVLNRIRSRFLREVDPAENPWPPSKAAIARRASGGTGTLFDTGRLFRSIQLASLQGNEARIGTDVPYAKYHQLGIGQVQRQFLGISDGDARLVERVLQRMINQQLEI